MQWQTAVEMILLQWNNSIFQKINTAPASFVKRQKPFRMKPEFFIDQSSVQIFSMTFVMFSDKFS